MSPNQRSTDDLLRRYLTGALTAPEEAELERRALTDEPLAEAMRGLRAKPAADHEARVASMIKRARTQVQGEAKGASVQPSRRNYARYAAAATVLLLFVVGALWLVPTLVKTEQAEVAMKAPSETPLPEPEQAPVSAGVNDENSATTSAETPKTEPPSPTPDPRPRPTAPESRTAKKQAPNEPSIKVEKRATVTAEARARRETLAEAANAILKDETEAETIAEEEVMAEAAPPPAPTVAPAPAAVPASIGTTDQTAGVVKVEADQVEDTGRDDETGGNYLEGRITNENGMPILSALVRLPGLPLGERTDSSGYFRLPADATTTRLEVSHPAYEPETVDLRGSPENLQISLDRKEWQPERPGMMQDGARSVIILDNKPGYAAPLEGYATLRKRIEDNRPTNLPTGKVRFSFTVNTDGTLTDFEFRGEPSPATMDYIGETIVKTSVWEIMQGDEPVRVYFKVVF